MLDKYLNLIQESSNDLFIYHYTRSDMSRINRNGILSLYGLYHKDKDEYNKAIEGYLPRIKAKIGYKKEYSIEDIEKYFKMRGLDIRAIFFSFWELTLGLHKGRDAFIKDTNLIRININKLNRSWEYNLINANKVTSLSYMDIEDYCKMDSIKYQKKQGGMFLFSHIPHLAVIPKDGIISTSYFHKS